MTTALTKADDSIAPAMRARIAAELARVEREQEVRILYAIESGSRAWGFASPDSDYDVRFIYARPRDWYLSIEARRDVIELPIAGDLDVNGWDVKKALTLLCKPNPVSSTLSPISPRPSPIVTRCFIII